MGYYMSEYFQHFNYLIKIYIQCTIQNSQTSKQFCCLLYDLTHVLFTPHVWPTLKLYQCISTQCNIPHTLVNFIL